MKLSRFIGRLFLAPRIGQLREAQRAFDFFIRTYAPRYPKATRCVQQDREELLVFYEFPTQH